CKNYLEPVVIRKYPVIRQIKDRLTRLGCGYAQMSGSGPSVFGEVKGKPQGERVLAEIKQKYPRGFLVESCEKGVEMEG
ncbi:MAG: 4-(cytidine 5'-diphospho)-2-C-methyl-D-erythritol kinase, partial [Candidatus Moranbacteria bacterium]|nr:4-(cytidine 5'-diphospho)-2-C-methyl-D-erythritol kinase [Candidatus Moranbacteria bacterium]